MTTEALSFPLVRIKDFIELTKPRLVSLVIFSTAVGYFLASPEGMNIPRFLTVLAGTFLVAGGSMGMNQWLEVEEDSKMERTMNRPLPARRLRPAEALVFSVLVSLAGLGMLYWGVNACSAFVAALTWIFYVAVYTPLKKKTTLCTVIGAIPGALPPLIGWVAVSGSPSYEAWILPAIIFFWQMPHFLAIAWMRREDFRRAGFWMLSVTDPSGERVARQMILYTAFLLPVSLLLNLFNLTGIFYFFGVLALGVIFLAHTISGLNRMHQKARPLFRFSLVYLSLLLLLILADKQ